MRYISSNGSYGTEAASQYYFSKPTGKLSKAEITLLAVILNNPKNYKLLMCRRSEVRLN
ncbi:transglycosylase domain-containing protein [Peribacillus simplex]|uniref:transglycosylase domain-containing protein n=1 Tax=Peribacillus simplex TaxID=1478 RepID=UPI003D26EA7B